MADWHRIRSKNNEIKYFPKLRAWLDNSGMENNDISWSNIDCIIEDLLKRVEELESKK